MSETEAASGSTASQHIWIITGPAGCGKSTVAQYLSRQLGVPYVEGDEFHTQQNIDKMAAGISLTDEDRWEWLIALRQHALDLLASGATAVVLSCSALKRKYRDVIRIAHSDAGHVLVHFLYLKADEQLLLSRVGARQGHYMNAGMVQSQLESLEEPQPDEVDCLVVDVSGTQSEVEALALATVRGGLAAPVQSVAAS